MSESCFCHSEPQAKNLTEAIKLNSHFEYIFIGQIILADKYVFKAKGFKTAAKDGILYKSVY